MAVDSLWKSGPSGGNCSIPDRPFMMDTEGNHSENVPSDQKHNSAETADDYSAGNLNNWATLTGKGCIWVGFPCKVVVVVVAAAAADNSAVAAAGVSAWPADIRCHSHPEITALVEMSCPPPLRLHPL